MFLNLVLYEFPASFIIRRVGDWESQPMPFNWGGGAFIQSCHFSWEGKCLG